MRPTTDHHMDTPHTETIVPHEDAYQADVEQRNTSSRNYDSLPARVNAVIFTVLFALEALLALRFTLIAFGANPNSGFVDFILDVSWPFVRPFDGAFANRTWDEGIIEVSTLLAMGVYAIAFGVVALLVTAILPRANAGSDTVTRRSVSHLP